MKLSKVRGLAAGIFFGIGLGVGFIPILIASLLIKENLFLECFDRMDGFWREQGWK